MPPPAPVTIATLPRMPGSSISPSLRARPPLSSGRSDQLRLEILLVAHASVLAPEAALAVAAEGRVDAEVLAAVHGDRSGAEPAREPQRAGLVRSGDRAREPVARVVGDADGVVFVLVGNDAEHRAEDLVLRQRALVRD